MLNHTSQIRAEFFQKKKKKKSSTIPVFIIRNFKFFFTFSLSIELGLCQTWSDTKDSNYGDVAHMVFKLFHNMLNMALCNSFCVFFLVGILLISGRYNNEPSRWKTNNVVSEEI